jgi:hypothetical protein
MQGAAGLFPVMNICHGCHPQFSSVHSEIGNGCPGQGGCDARKLRMIRVFNGMARKTASGRNPNDAVQFYRESMKLLQQEGVPFLVGGAFALALHTDIVRDTKDFDLFVRAADVDLILEMFRRRGFRAEKTHPHWLAKVFHGDDLIDIIYRGGNGLCAVDESWFARAPEHEVLGLPARVCAPEEIIWMKAYIMERERYDGADVAHLLVNCAEQIDWQHLLERFGPDWRVLLSHLVLFGFIYPTERDRVPASVIEALTEKMREEGLTAAAERVCRGTLLSRAQYLHDVREAGFRDARLDERCRMTTAELEAWTALRPRS